MSESLLLKQVMLAISKTGTLVFRNNVGVAVYPDGSRVVYGLCPGSSDLITLTPTLITEKHLGSVLGIFGAVEIKTPRGRPTDAQARFIQAVAAKGGRAGIARSVAEALAILDG